ncbi:hypothetical protein LFM56_14310 [Cellulomonas iranensis]|uniref:IQ calmodulin-binding motif-containing protein n=1 Tax=Cellulomonas iranensis TaxID=76862 RepID=UPI001CF59F22|nr:hypothetical protein [Cellulomonas iranensis]UCN14050.1 hypothetical protein LFM56_14310 [Cellulomonas iranensis]
MANHGDGFELTRARVWGIVLGAVVLALGGYYWASQIEDTGQSVVLGLASALVSVAVATLIAEALLRPAFTHDLLRVAGLRARLQDVGLVDLVPESDVPWPDFYSKSSRYKIAIVNPTYAMQRHAERLLDAAGHRTAEVTILLPSPTNGAAAGVAASLGIERQAYEQAVRDAATDLESMWRARREQKALRKKSSLTIVYVNAPIRTSIFVSDQMSILIAPPLLAERTSPELAVLLAPTRNTDVSEWLEKRLGALESAGERVPVFTDAPEGSEVTISERTPR